ncbi:hypothetical protein NYG90_03210 [Helicobacter sp. XJK30-2]|uniref:Uncharacterized protein n=1 Tax=Helicobacter zhangjianzhongii TaxID=2974574 RepID=A0ACC6FQZ7_9HELI|nr:hypothetical protein [Helicobacter sp. XJK30-2]MDL0081693.1 hypothetical protein [Helicobacter sp. XJK30-2]
MGLWLAGWHDCDIDRGDEVYARLGCLWRWLLVLGFGFVWFWCWLFAINCRFYGAGAGILLSVNEQARAVESTKTSEAQFL